MNTICEEFDLRIKNEAVKGTFQWIKDKLSHPYEERKVFAEYASNLSKEGFTIKQSLIFDIATQDRGVLNIQELDVDLTQLDEEDIAELIVYYDLEKPAARYREIKASIAAPTSYLTGIPYRVIRALHKRGKVPFDREIFAACLVRFNVWHGT
ncbi:MAG TPA: hypothetical protein DCS93_31370, partial [Microscillaceae bacterium]|nr:hypothetical protein [Microscillaceae bacterium]